MATCKLVENGCFNDGVCHFTGECENKVITNSDRTRAVSDDELARMFVRAVADGCPPEMDWDCAKDEGGWDACDACWFKWLQLPAGEVHDNGK